MKRLAGQAGTHLGRALHSLGLTILTAMVVILLSLGALAYRLSLGPLQIPYLAAQLANIASGPGIHVEIASASLAWAGYAEGGSVPLYLQLGAMSITNGDGLKIADIPDARLIFLPEALLGGKAPINVDSTDMRFRDSNVPVSLRAAIRLSDGFQLSRAALIVTLGPGQIGVGDQAEMISGGHFTLRVTQEDASLTNGSLQLAPVGQSAPVIGVSGTAHLKQEWQARLVLTADRVAAADLPSYWPAGVSKDTRHWVTTNITAGIAHDAKFNFDFSAPEKLSSIALVNATGAFTGDDLTLTWLPKAQPITSLFGTLTFVDKDNILITAQSAKFGKLPISSGTMRITGVAHKDQFSVVDVSLGGSVSDAFAVLDQPPLLLLNQAPAELLRATGTVQARAQANIPLKKKLELADVVLALNIHLTDLAGPVPLAGLSYEDGALEINATLNGLTLSGGAMLAGQKAAITGQLDFAMKQLLRRLEVKTVIGPELLHKYGLDAGTSATDPVSGAMPSDLLLTGVPGSNDLAVQFDANLTPARLGVPMLGWSKQAGVAGALHVAARLHGDSAGIGSLQQIDATAPALAIHGRLNDDTLILSEFQIGRTAAEGTVRWPTSADESWRVDLSGDALDLRAISNGSKGQTQFHKPVHQVVADEAAHADDGIPWQAKLRFANVYLAEPPAPGLQDVTLSGFGAGADVRNLLASGQAGGTPVSVTVTSDDTDAALRRFSLQSGNAGALLRASGAFKNLQNGTLSLTGAYAANGPIAGTATLNDYRLLHAPALGKIMQGVTIFGLPEATSGPGLAFKRMIAPFSIANNVLTLKGARAYSASLGFTASGTIGLNDGVTDIDATIIPAYALNQLPSRIPLIGRLFSGEKGGGLISVRAKITGTLDNPTVHVNPLSAFTPGLLRDIFGMPGGDKNESGAASGTAR